MNCPLSPGYLREPKTGTDVSDQVHSSGRDLTQVLSRVSPVMAEEEPFVQSDLKLPSV